MRLFVSIDLPDRLGDAVVDAQERLGDAVVDAQERLADADGLRFVDPDNAHLTVFFLGEVDPDRQAEIEAALERAVAGAGVDPFELRVGGFGVFPSVDYISVIWAGVRDGGGVAETTRLAEATERELEARGFEGNNHEFTPHVTLARMDDARGKELVQRVVRETDPDLGTFRVEKLRLTESTLTSDGPAYETRKSIELGA
jgi:2'-5' RNA ligase